MFGVSQLLVSTLSSRKEQKQSRCLLGLIRRAYKEVTRWYRLLMIWLISQAIRQRYRVTHFSVLEREVKHLMCWRCYTIRHTSLYHIRITGWSGQVGDQGLMRLCRDCLGRYQRQEIC